MPTKNRGGSPHQVVEKEHRDRSHQEQAQQKTLNFHTQRECTTPLLWQECSYPPHPTSQSIKLSLTPESQ